MSRQTSRSVQLGQLAGVRPRITEILNEALREHVTIVNEGAMAQPMDGWALASLRGERVYTFPSNLILLPGMEVTIHSGQEAHDHPPCDLLWTQEQVWNNGADTAVLFDAHGVEVDRVTYPQKQARGVGSAARSRKWLIHDGDTWRIVDEPVHPSERSAAPVKSVRATIQPYRRDQMDWARFNPPAEIADILAHCPKVVVASTVDELARLACGVERADANFEVAYDIPGKGRVIEAVVARVRNGIVVNYAEPYMRRRDPDCMVIGDDQPTDKQTFAQRFGKPFAPVREETFAWLKTQELLVFGFYAGQADMGMNALVLAPANTGFFALGLAMLQGIIPYEEIPANFAPKAVVFVAPPFRHTHFNGKQVVVHNRLPSLHEMFSFNLYPGPSAKKGVYGALIARGEREGWVAAHCSTVQVVTPYDNVVTIMHEGASGGGKSEMLEQAHREPDGRLLLGENLLTAEKRYLEIPRSCALHPVTDDIALCEPCQQGSGGKLQVRDAEDGWFVRVNHITHYGTDVHLERLTAQPEVPLLFFNIDAVAGSRALIWEHTEDAPGKHCPNPRVIIPRSSYPGIVHGSVSVDIRSLGVRTPPCTRERPTYGILGLFHILPPALAWLWRLVPPRGHDNPSIIANARMETEGVGSYWPFAAGRRVAQANLLLDQFVAYTRTRHILCPNQHVGVWRTGFMPQWIAREYLARRGSAKFRPDQLVPARCPLLGQVPHQLHVEGRMIPQHLLQVDLQPEVGEAAYDQGAEILYDYFRTYLADFCTADLAPLGRQIIKCCFDRGTVPDYQALILGE